MQNRENYLIESDWLYRHLDDPELRILDVTAMLTSKLENLAEKEVFAKGHIPGAVFFDVASAKGVLSAPEGDLPWTWPSKGQVEQVMSQVGVSNETRIILYAASPRKGVDFGPMWCTRAWWILHHHGANCAILNGGFEKWSNENRPISTETNQPDTTTFTATQPVGAIADKTKVGEALKAENVAVIDALSPASYSGADPTQYGRRKGHISGAVNVHYGKLVNLETYTFANLEELRMAFSETGMDPRQPAITYCGGGIAATLDAFSLLRMGNENVAVYDASLMEWANDPSLPMTNPSET